MFYNIFYVIISINPIFKSINKIEKKSMLTCIVYRCKDIIMNIRLFFLKQQKILIVACLQNAYLSAGTTIRE